MQFRFLIPGILLLLMSCRPDAGLRTIPFESRNFGPINASWKYTDALELNMSYITPPADDWQGYYNRLLDYRQQARARLGDESRLFLDLDLRPPHHPGVGYRETGFGIDPDFAHRLNLQPGQNIRLSGESLVKRGDPVLGVQYVYTLHGRSKGLSYRNAPGGDSLNLSPLEGWQAFSLNLVVPEFSADSFWVAPRIVMDSRAEADDRRVLLRNLTLHVPATEYSGLSSSRTEAAAMDRHVYDRDDLAWMRRNFVMGFVFIWDSDFYDPATRSYRVDHYCRKMEAEFGGFQSVLLWHSYPQIGIDSRNQYELFDLMPGGLDSLRAVVDRFHGHGVKVFIAYTPWDEMTLRSGLSDEQKLAEVVAAAGIDGVFMDTKGEGAAVLREELDRLRKGVAIVPELLPMYRDIHGQQACSGSWAQYWGMQPYGKAFGVLHMKWLEPRHMQYQIDRWNRDHDDELMAAWINGSGMMVWENVFASWNPWNQRDRAVLRRMNPIWQFFAPLYTSDAWKPFYPLSSPEVLTSVWEDGQYTLVNIVYRGESEEIALKTDFEWDYGYDLWSGLPVGASGGTLRIRAAPYGCLVFGRGKAPEDLLRLAERQRGEAARILPTRDLHVQQLPVVQPLPVPAYRRKEAPQSAETLRVPGGRYALSIGHLNRETGCYPDPESDPARWWDDWLQGRHLQPLVHRQTHDLADYGIMAEVVSNRQYTEFLQSSGYRPVASEKFLLHWEGDVCPDSLLDKPVVYVSLEDARAYARWSGGHLPGEAEWQVAVERFPGQFVFNRVFEWTESERDDGHTRFVMLRGGCGDWRPWSSFWYFPGGHYPGGAQPANWHVKFLLMDPALDRAATLGFRCVYD